MPQRELQKGHLPFWHISVSDGGQLCRRLCPLGLIAQPRELGSSHSTIKQPKGRAHPIAVALVLKPSLTFVP